MGKSSNKSSSYRKDLRALVERYDARLERSTKHFRIVLPNGRFVFAPTSSALKRTIKNTERWIKRELAHGHDGRDQHQR